MSLFGQNSQNSSTKGESSDIKIQVGTYGVQQNSFRVKDFLDPVQGPMKLGRRKIGVARNLDFFTLDQNMSLKMK